MLWILKTKKHLCVERHYPLVSSCDQNSNKQSTIGMAVSTADPMLMKGSKNCIANSHGLESASTTADHDAKPNSKELHWE